MQIKVLEKELAKIADNIENSERNFAALKEKWLKPLKALIEQINQSFTKYFANIGCHGRVKLGIFFNLPSPNIFSNVEFMN